jgi:hypothetical protein
MVRSQALRDPIAHIDYRFEQILGAGIRFGSRRAHARVIPGVALIVRAGMDVRGVAQHLARRQGRR